MQIGTQAPRSAPEYWDVAVMGAGLAGIAAACTAARNGLRTLLVETGEKIGGVMSSCPGMMLGRAIPLAGASAVSLRNLPKDSTRPTRPGPNAGCAPSLNLAPR